MIPGVGLPCPQCKRELAPESWIDARDGVCLRCETEFQFVPFPALTATRTQATAQAAVLAADSVCFFHAENRAEAICEGCGRLLCPVCAVPFDGRKLCPACIATGKSAGEATVVRERVLYDSIALALALIPLMIWVLTVVTAPVALGMTIYAWKKPGSLPRGSSKVRLVIAGVMSVIQIGAWATFFVFLWLRR